MYRYPPGKDCRVTDWDRDATKVSNSCKHYEDKGVMLTYLRKNEDGEDERGYRQVCCVDDDWTWYPWHHREYVDRRYNYPRYDPWQKHDIPFKARRRIPRRWWF
jgi:hypothetical protein